MSPASPSRMWKPPTTTRIRPANIEMPNDAPPASGMRLLDGRVRLGIGAPPREGDAKANGRASTDAKEPGEATPHPKRAFSSTPPLTGDTLHVRWLSCPSPT